jgi:hypothetical protein
MPRSPGMGESGGRTGRPNAAEPWDGRERRAPILALSRTRLRLFQHAANAAGTDVS